MLHKTKNEVQQDKVRRAVEKTVLWLVRWSQVFFWLGMALVIGEMAFMIFSTMIDMPLFIFTEGEKIVLYSIGTVGAVMFAWGTIVYVVTLLIDERSKKRPVKTERM